MAAAADSARLGPVPILAAVLALLLPSGAAATGPPELILHGGRVHTMDPARPEATALALRGERIVKVGSDAEVLALRGPATKVIALEGRLALPGFIDAHTHFENAVDWRFRLGVHAIADSPALVARLAAAVRGIPAGMWISGGDLGAAAAWAAEAKKEPAPRAFIPDLAAVDAVTPEHPVLLRRHDLSYFANSAALRRARWDRTTPDPRGGRLERDARGEPTGILHGRAGERIAELMPPPSMAQKLVGARLALAELAAAGITSIHDVARLDSASQTRVFHTHVERSSSDLDIFRELQRRGELTARVYAFLTLPLWREVLDAGIRPRADEGLIRYGGLKGFVDGFLMEQPYLDEPDYAGSFTFRFTTEEDMARAIADADRHGFDAVVHAVGDKAHRLLLDWYEAAYRANPPRDRRFRMVHTWYPSAADIARAGRLKLVADITPQHVVRGIRTVDRSLGPQRAKTAHAWRQLKDAGVRLNIVSDWPGSYNEQEPTPLAPLENIFMAVTRQSLDGRPPGGWHVAEKLTLEEALEAYTVNPAWSAYEEDRKGTLTEGKLADVVVLSRDILEGAPEDIRRAQVDYTILGGRIIHAR
jgi:predicted amidohydrolase YtcJ